MNNLTPQQQDALQQLKHKLQSHVESNPDFQKAFESNLRAHDTTETIILNRYLRARKYNVNKAFHLLIDSLQWRMDTSIDTDINFDTMAGIRALKGSYIAGFSKRGDSVCYIVPGTENPYSSQERINYLIYLMEEASRLSVTARMIWIMDFSMYGQRAKDPDSKKVAMDSIKILQHHYPETLEHLFIVDAPWFFRALWFVLKPFIDSVTKQKVQFISRSQSDVILQYVPDNMLDEAFGGSLELTDDMKADWRWMEEAKSQETCKSESQEG